MATRARAVFDPGPSLPTAHCPLPTALTLVHCMTPRIRRVLPPAAHTPLPLARCLQPQQHPAARRVMAQAAQKSEAADGSTEPEVAGSLEAASPVPSLPESEADSTADEQVRMLILILVLVSTRAPARASASASAPSWCAP